MKMKMIIASAALAAMSATAFAQTGSGAGAAGGSANSESANAMTYASDAEETMWTNNMESMGGFFTDDTMSEMRSEEEVTAAYGGLTTEQQEQLKADCEAAELNRGDYGEVSLTLCSQLGAL
ncbi:hypothetical protein [Aliihoeflea sp. 40Bstr573]|uniref:hypothetical protein n=1 Tax=Aliihoeflea sp. 40Bstr573 TaxID=2696467 RepID=UPI0020965E85|nr:hypothetical protein [Aliihoeflea sp. 40Bstr573]MCO6386444.1 hypothetical protein [Aliihoeflea sp. 40Bstr573]